MKPLEQLSFDLRTVENLLIAHPEDVALQELHEEALALQASITEVLAQYAQETAISIEQLLNGLAEKADHHKDLGDFINEAVPTPMCDAELLPAFVNIRAHAVRSCLNRDKRDWLNTARGLLCQVELLNTSKNGEYVLGRDLKSRYDLSGIGHYSRQLDKELEPTSYVLVGIGMHGQKQFRIEKRAS